MHRWDLRDTVKGLHPPVRLLALNWSLDLPHAEIHRICADRILARGANHQTLHSDELGKAHESVIWRFLHTTEPLTDDKADTIIQMDVREDLKQAVSHAVDAVVGVLDSPRPDAEQSARRSAHAGIVPRSQMGRSSRRKRRALRLHGISPFPPRST
jgi:tRNA ligase